MFSIGDFSRATGLTVKTIRLYHEKGLLMPAWIDNETSYRYYDRSSLERARIIRALREMDFPLAEIRDLLESEPTESGIIPFLERQRARILERQESLGRISRTLDTLIAREKEAFAMVEKSTFEIEEKDLSPLKVASLRWKGRYADTGEAFQKVFRQFGRHARGKPLNLYYDADYKEQEADIESCIPVSDRCAAIPDGFAVRTLPSGRFVTLVHKGPYDEISRSYARLMTHLEEKGYQAELPYREIYLKGPGMLFRGNPKRYLTEIQIKIPARG